MTNLANTDIVLAKEAMRLSEAGELSEAQALFESLIQRNPCEVLFCWQLGYVLLEKDSPQNAIECFRRAIKLDELCKPAWGGLGRAFMDLEDWEKAESALRTRLAIEPSATHFIFLARVLTAKGNPKAAIDCCNNAIGMDAQREDAYTLRSALFTQIGKFGEAIDDCHKAITIDPEYAEAYLCLASAYVGVRRFDDASGAIQHAIDIDPGFAPSYSELGILHYTLSDLEMAETYLRYSLRLNDTSYKAHYYLGLVLREADRLAEARAEFAICHQLRARQREVTEISNEEAEKSMGEQGGNGDMERAGS